MMIRSALKLLLGFVLALPVLQALLFWVAELLRAMGDDAAALFIRRTNVAAGTLWLISLVGLVVALALHAVGSSGFSRDEIDEPPA